jgi:hypothetical protein
MSFKDLEKGNRPHTDTPEQAKARAEAAAAAKAKHDAKHARQHEHGEGAERGEPSGPKGQSRS